MYICPVCSLPLSQQQSQVSLLCENGHCFDRHKKGYINLLLAQNKRSKQPGDDKNMVAGRHAFLRADYYEPLVKKITDIMVDIDATTLLDAGCGEGYYLSHILKQLPTIKSYGIDISKPAIQSAASHYKGIEWAVGSVARLPYTAASFDIILSVFSRIDSKEFSRVLRPGGSVVFVGPGVNHLQALRQLIYSRVQPYSVNKHESYFANDYQLVDLVELTLPLNIQSNEHIFHLLNMTPHGQRVNSSGLSTLRQLDHLEDVADFRICIYRKK